MAENEKNIIEKVTDKIGINTDNTKETKEESTEKTEKDTTEKKEKEPFLAFEHEVDKPLRNTKEKIDEVKARRRLPRYINNIDEYIDRKGTTHLSMKFTPNVSLIDARNIRDGYYKLFGKKRLKDDEEIMEYLIERRKEVFQHRINCRINLYSKGELIASLYITHILIEHGQEIINFWHGITIDPSGFSALVLSFEAKMVALGVNSVKATWPPIKRATIDDVETEFSAS